MPLETSAPVVAESAPAAAPAAVEAPAAIQSGDRSLADHMADHMAAVQQSVQQASLKQVTTAAPVKTPEPEAESATEVSAEPAEPAAAETVAAVEATPAEPVKPPEDERAKALAEYVRGKNANRQEARRLKEEAARIESLAVKARQDQEAAQKILSLRERAVKDPVGAVEELLGKDKFSNDFLLAALDRVTNGQPDKQPTEEERQRVISEAAVAKVREELRAERDAEQKAAAEKAQQAAEEGKARYVGAVASHLKANAEKYPMIASEGVDTAVMIAAVEAHHRETGVWPTTDQVLGHFEKQLVEQTSRRLENPAMRAILEKRKSAAAPAVRSAAAAPVKNAGSIDARGKVGKKIDLAGTVEERRAAIMARLDGRISG